MRLSHIVAPFAMIIAVCPLGAQNRNVPIENEYVRVLSVTDEPGTTPGSPHEHKDNRVMIYLDSGDMQLKYADGKVENQHWKPGDVTWSPASGTHTSQNMSQRPIRIIEIELHKPAGAAESAPDRTHSIIDNSQVRVYRSPTPPSGGKNFIAVDVKSGSVAWNKMPEGSGPFVITELK